MPTLKKHVDDAGATRPATNTPLVAFRRARVGTIAERDYDHVVLLFFLAVACAVAGADAALIDFAGAEVGKPPAGVEPVGNAAMVAAEFEGKKVLELPGEPLDTYAALFGPGDRADLDASARVWGATSGRRFPEFGVGLGDTGGYKVLVLPGPKKLELRKGDDKVKDVSMAAPWQSETWTTVRIRQVKTGDGKWKVQAKAWPSASPEPQAWAVEHEAPEAPAAGRASVWGIPFSGKPIRFDALSAGPAGG